jgi:hypothetical protein
MAAITRERVKVQQGHRSGDTVVFNFLVEGVRHGGFTAINTGTGWTAFDVDAVDPLEADLLNDVARETADAIQSGEILLQPNPIGVDYLKR